MPRLAPKKPVSKSRSARTSTRRQSLAGLAQLQRNAFAVIRRPLSRNENTQRTWTDGRPTFKFVAQFIKPNDRLTSLERIELYNKQYWFRLLDCLYDDYPGLRAILGENKFRALRVAYLDRYPSRSFTLRDLGSKLVEFLEENPRLIRPHVRMCQDMARFEWAQVVAFDGPARPPITPDDLLGKNPGKLKLALQPYVTLLEFDYPLDEFVIALKKESAGGQVSNATEMTAHTSRSRRPVRLPKKSPVFVGVHRWENSLYYKRLEPAQYRLISAIRDGKSIAAACEQAIAGENDPKIDWAAKIRTWLQVFTELGWLCRPN